MADSQSNLSPDRPQKDSGQWARLTRSSISTPFVAIAIVLCATVVRLAFLQSLGMRATYITFYPAVMLAAVYGGLGAGLLATVLSAAMADYFWLKPVRSLVIVDSADWLSLAIFVLSGAMISWITGAIRRAQQRAARAEFHAHSTAQRARMTDILRESEDRFRALAEATFEGIAITEAGKYVDANEQWLQMLGYSREEVIGTEVATYIAPEDKDRVLRNIHAGIESLTELTVIRKDGTRLIAEAHGRTVDYQNRKVRFTAIRDVTARKRAETQLAEALQRLEAHMANSPLAIIEWGADMRLTRWSREAERIFGWTAQEVLGKRMQDFRWIYEEDAAQVQEVAQELQHGVQRFSANRNYRKDGTVVDCHWYNSALVDGQGAMRSIMSLVQDVTAQKQAEEVLHRYELLARQSRDIILFIDREDRRILDANPAAAEAYGYSIEELRARTIHDLRPATTPPMTDEQLAGADAYGVLFETFHQRRDGSPFPVEVSTRTIPISGRRTLVSVIRDITHRKQLEDTLKFLLHCGAAPGEDFFEELARYLAQNLGMDYVCIDRLHQNLLAAQTLAIYFDGKFDDNVSYSLKDTPCGDVVGKTICCFAEGVRYKFPKDVVLQDMLAESYIGTTLWSSQGKPIGLIAIIGRTPLEDTSLPTSLLQLVAVRAAGELERREAEESLAAARDAAEAASKAKDHFLAVLSHELRNPLQPVLATAGMLRKDPRFDADTHEQLDVIHRNAELEARLIDDLLDVTRIERGKVDLDRHPVELGTIIRRAAEVCWPDIDARQLQFSIDMGKASYLVSGDAARLQQIFWNLIKNAVKFTPSAGSVDIRCRPRPAGFVTVEVKDNGEGIEPEALSRIFNAFEQAERSITRQFGGLGLGLAISRGLVELHGGTIEAHSAGKGQGSTFTVRLPLLSADAAGPALRPSATMPPVTIAAGRLRILLVEDHRDSARVMTRLLTADGHDVQTAVDVATALKLASEMQFDMLLSDLGLPDGTGIDLMHALRAKGIKLPAIALSGYGQEADVQASREAGFKHHLTKPVVLRRLQNAINQLMADAN